jgi:hypothetical protein
MNSNDITKKCVLVKLSIPTYAGTVKCDKISKEAAQQHNADEDAISSIIKAMDPTDRKDIMLARSQARAIWIKDSLPWMDNGMRLVPVEKYLKMKDGLQAKQADFEDAVQVAVDRYDEIRNKMLKRVGNLESEVTFPSKEAFARKFKFVVRTSVVTNPNDVRIEALPAEEIARIQAEGETLLREQLESSQRDVLARVAEKLGSVIEKLSEVDDPSAKGKHFKDSLIGNVKGICEEMKELNVTGSSKLDALLDRIGNTFGLIEPGVLRDKKAGQPRRMSRSDT